MDFTTLLANTLSYDQATREDAARQLESCARDTYANYLLLLCDVMANEFATDDVRQMGGIALKNALSEEGLDQVQEEIHGWGALDETVRTQIKRTALLTLQSPRKVVGCSASQVVAAIAEIELLHGQWPDLVHILLDNVTATDNVNLKQATLKTIGYICEGVDCHVLASQSNELLTAVVQGARAEEQNPEVRLEAIKALYNSLEFARKNFARESERNFIMHVVCEAMQSDSSELMVSAYECLVKIMQLYYGVMPAYMDEALLPLTLRGMTGPDEKVALQAIEFWSTICDVEIAVKVEIEQAHLIGEPPEFMCHDFSGKAIGKIVPALLWVLTKQDEDEDEDEWTPSMSSATCLSLLAQCVRDAIINPIVPFVESNINNGDWRYRAAAVMAFGSIMDGPPTNFLAPLVDQALPTLMTMMQDPVVSVKDAVAWTLGRVCEFLSPCIQPKAHLSDLVSSLLCGLQDNLRIIANCCWALMNLAEQLAPLPSFRNPTSTMSIYFEGIATSLLQFTDNNCNEANCRTSAYEALSAFIMYSANDCIPMVQNIVLAILDRLESTTAMENQILNADDRLDHSELQSSLLGVLTNSIRRLPQDITHVSDRIMAVVLQLLTTSSKQATTTEDAFLVIGAMTTVLDGDFQRYTDTFVPLLCAALEKPQEYQLCLIAVGIIGDLCRALGPASSQHCRKLVPLLIINLKSPVLHSSVKPCILSCFGDIALATGKDFVQYLEAVLFMLETTGTLCARIDGNKVVDLVNALLEGTVEAYVGIIQGMRSCSNVNVLLPHLGDLFTVLICISWAPDRSDDLTLALLGLIGDLAETFGHAIAPFVLDDDWLDSLLRHVRTDQHASNDTKNTARWAKRMVKMHCL